MTARRTKFPVTLAAALLVPFACAKSAKDPGGLMLSISTDGPRLVDEIDVKVLFAGQVLNSRTVAVPGEAPLPTTLAIVSNGDPTAAVEITVVGWSEDQPVDRRDTIVTQVPTDRLAHLPIVLSGRCTSRVALNEDDEVVSTCPDQKTCSPETGACVDVYVESATLTSYQPGAENDVTLTPGAGGADTGGDAGAPGNGGNTGGAAGAGGTGATAGAGATGAMGGTGGNTAGMGGSGGGSGGSGGSGSGIACDDGLDNDEDGAIDGFDPECKSRTDTSEDSFGTGVPGENVDPGNRDCYFDSNSGAGDDQCQYASECLTGELGPADEECMLSAACLDFCQPRTPNGCDCFGCCSVAHEGQLLDVWIGPTCDMSKLDDDVACPPCTKSTTCRNDLGTCELALGMTVDDLPGTCTDYECEALTLCGPDAGGDCGSTEFCANGCCILGP